MLIQHWTLKVKDSRWLIRARIAIALSLVCSAGGLLALVTGLIGVSGWWGDWLWPWPILLYVSWVVAFVPAPVSAAQSLVLTETGEFAEHHIQHSLRTPWLIALRLGPLPSGAALTTASAIKSHWHWVVRDQLSAEHWTRLNRVCQNRVTRAKPLT